MSAEQICNLSGCDGAMDEAFGLGVLRLHETYGETLKGSIIPEHSSLDFASPTHSLLIQMHWIVNTSDLFAF